jgi:hypothetical protein
MNRGDGARMKFGVHGALLTCVVVALVLGSQSSAAGQAAPTAGRSASPVLPGEHWAVEAAKRAEALGLVRLYLSVQAEVPRHVVSRALREAADRAAEGAPHLVAVTRAWLARFAEEFPESDPLPGGFGLRSLGNSVGVEYTGNRGSVLPGTGLFPEELTGAASVPSGAGALGALSLAAGIGPNFSLLAEPVARAEGVDLQRWEVRAGWRKLGVSVGRQPVTYGYARSGGLVLSGSEPIERLQVETQEPVRLPGFLSRLGPVTAHAFGGRLQEPRHRGEPYLWGMAGSLQPHPRVTLSIHRASIMGGDSVPTPVTLRNFLRTFVGHNLLTFENEVVAGQVRVRLPTERLLPLTLYTEWGAEDGAGAWRDVPGRLYGALVPALPGLPQAAMGAEYVSFAGACCGNPPWYRHHPHTGGWVLDERPLGHPLGGQGRQATVFANADLFDARLRLDGQGFSRRREGENLYVPGREGSSTGFELRAATRLFPRTDATISLFREAGVGWTERSAALGLRAFF